MGLALVNDTTTDRQLLSAPVPLLPPPLLLSTLPPPLTPPPAPVLLLLLLPLLLLVWRRAAWCCWIQVRTSAISCRRAATTEGGSEGVEYMRSRWWAPWSEEVGGYRYIHG